jgi:anti-sigma factor RsiW
MNITRNVVEDLLTLYLAGEANADTRALVEEWLKTDPEMARRVERARSTPLPPVAVPPPTVEKRALDRTRRRWRLRSIVLGVAIYVTTLPLTVTFNSSGFRGLLIEDWSERIVLVVIAAALWWVYFGMGRRWQASSR